MVRLDPGRLGRFADRARRCGVRAVAIGDPRTYPYGCTALSVYAGSSAGAGSPTPTLLAFLALQASVAPDRTALARTVADLLDRRHATGLAIGRRTRSLPAAALWRLDVRPLSATELSGRAGDGTCTAGPV
ncbi:hypothetical protein ACH4E7_38455 [Kitasatospora sp. NPDC018058]|uniref:hypothetical protein n=1 Tax=Kitasatospora sp. NPDC018058 TaxID=3364025 RepID=UPI0037C060BC